jgi:D-ribose pyranose/furanose isomerase RbsD
MKEKKLQIFVSSTFTDLIEERQAAVEAILSSGHIPAGMELFSAGDESQMTVIERWIDESDVYLLILGGRYGSIDPKSGKSFTQLEYEYALEKKKPLFAVVIKPEALEVKVRAHGSEMIEKENPKLLREFQDSIQKNLVKFWTDKKDIKLAIHETISDFIYRKELTGWIRGDKSIDAGLLAEEIARLTKENAELREKLVSIDLSATQSRYASLTFDELKTLLKAVNVLTKSGSSNLFDFMIQFGQELVSGYYPVVGDKELDALKKLLVYKVITYMYYPSKGTGRYQFSDDGHNFYLKALALQIHTTKSN